MTTSTNQNRSKALLFIATFALAFQIGSCRKEAITEDVGRGPTARKGMVATAHPIASEVGAEILRKGGNAFDAAIAVHYALAVVYPFAGNIGGGGFMVFRKADGTTGTLDFREKAPAAAHRDMFLDQQGNVVEGLSTKTHLASGVPGSVDGMFRIYESFSTLPLTELMAPAIALAQNGFPLTKREADRLNQFRADFLQMNADTICWVRAKPWQEADSVHVPELAATLERIRDQGRAGFYEGETARLLLAEMERGKGIISQADLDQYQSVFREPVMGTYRGHRIVSMPPPSSGGVALLQLLKSAEAYDLRQMGHNSVETIHLMTELSRRVYADRATYLGDPDFYKVPVQMLTDPAYLTDRMKDINPAQATNSQDIKAGSVQAIERFETTHFSVVDAQGNAVAITTTLNGAFGNKVMVRGAGFFLNNEMDDFSVKPGVPNQFGMVGGEANAVEAGKRMLSSMTPTIVEKDGKLLMVLGTPGGSTIITSVFQTIMNVVDHGMTMQQAVDAKKTHAQWLPDWINVEEGTLDSLSLERLRAMGHEIKLIPALGRMDCILVLPDGRYEGGSDRTRADNTSVGVD